MGADRLSRTGAALEPPGVVDSVALQERTLDEIPCLRLGWYVRFRWGSPELEAWLARHQETR
jgi:hypothetical protein